MAGLCAATGTSDEDRLQRLFQIAGERWMAEQALRQAALAGFAEVYVLAGGLAAWREAGLPLKK